MKTVFLKWLKTSGLAALGGGIAAIVATAADPTKYRFPQDLGSGKMWPYFFSGVGVTFAALLIKSPLGERAMTIYRDSQDQLKASQQTITQTKAELKTAAKPEGK